MPEGLMGTGEWLLLIVSLLAAIYLAVALWKPEKF
jgi:K+-transporting ATPase KdpF subunit